MSSRATFSIYVILCLTFLRLPLSHAEDTVSVTGRVSTRAAARLNERGVREDPSILGTVKLNAAKHSWRLYSVVEGAWDGAVRPPRRDHSLLKNYHDVYQDNTPYLEFKEFYLEKSFDRFDLRAGLQRFSWGRLDEYPVNDLFNPWDYTRFILRPLEERKIGVPSVSALMSRDDWTCQAVWVPLFVPYHLPRPNERWSAVSAGSALSHLPDAEVIPQEPDLPARNIGNGSFGLRMQRMGQIEWAVNVFHGFDPRPVFRTTALRITQAQEKILIDPGFVPSFHKITSVGMDVAAVKRAWSLRAEAAYTFNRPFNVRQELWGYPQFPAPGSTPLNPVETKKDSLDYGVAADYRLFEDVTLTVQAQQTIIFNRPDTLYERTFETILWANLKAGWMNQKIETNLNLAYNPEHGGRMARANAYYTFTDSWKAGIAALLLDGPPQSLFGRYSKNDQLELEVIYSW